MRVIRRLRLLSVVLRIGPKAASRGASQLNAILRLPRASEALRQLGDREIEDPRDRFDVAQRHVPLSALDTADVGTVQLASRREFFLAEVGPMPERLHPAAEFLGDVGRPPGHWRTRKPAVDLEPRTMSHRWECVILCANFPRARPALNIHNGAFR